jgi:hypothetical protein
MGERDSLQKRIAEEAEKCVKTFDCEVAELPALIQNFKTEADKQIAKVEYALGLRADAPAEEAVEPEPAPVAPPVAPKSRIPSTVPKSRIPGRATVLASHDEDGL